MTLTIPRGNASDLVRITFAPKEDITAYEIARMIWRGWPIIVDTASGDGSLLTTFHVTRVFWDSEVDEGLKRHFEVAA